MACRGTALPFFIEYYRDDKIEEDKIVQTCNMHGKHKKCRKYFGKETHRLLRNAKVFFSVHKSPPLDTVLSQLNSVHSLTSFSFTICINIILPFIKQWITMARFPFSSSSFNGPIQTALRPSSRVLVVEAKT
jgi:hypothetical protein